MLDAVREGGLLSADTPLVAMLSGGRDSVCLLDLAVRLLGPAPVTAVHVNYGLRDDSDADEAHCAALCARLGVELELERPRRPEGPGNLQSWARDTRYAAAAQLALGQGGADRHRAYGRRSGRDDPLPARLLAQSPGAAGDARPGRQLGRARCCASPASRRPPIAKSAGSPGATTRPTPKAATPAIAFATASPRRLPRCTLPRRATCCARPSCCATRPRCWTRWSTAELGANGSERGTIELSRLAELPPALRRLVVQRLADRAAGRPVPGAANHADQVAGLRRTGTAMLDLGGGVRAVVERGVLRAER